MPTSNILDVQSIYFQSAMLEELLKKEESENKKRGKKFYKEFGMID